MEQIHITLPDGSVKDVPKGTTPADIARSISPRLADAALVARVAQPNDGEGELIDLRRPLERDVKLQILTEKDPDALFVFRHSAAHLLAAAVMELYPSVKLGIGPPIDTGFFYEFLREEPFTQEDLAKKMGVGVEKIQQRVRELHEFNPMLGFRGCRLGIVYNEISEMQARAVFEAAALVHAQGVKANPEIMIPLVGFKKELDLQVEVVHRVAKEVMAEKKVKLNYLVGTMIEVPRGALTADEIAETAEFFSFGTNDLTQMSLGMSRDDSGSFLPTYSELEIVKKNPFATIDQTGVGQLMTMAVQKGNQKRPGIKLGICGEHGGDPDSVKFCHRIGLTYVSCSPFRVPVARLAAAQAALEEEAAAKGKKK